LYLILKLSLGTPTVVPFKSFNPEKDADDLHKAFKGFGT